MTVPPVAGQPAGQVGDPVDQRHAERSGQADKDQRGPERDDRHRQARRGARRCTLATAGLSSIAVNPATSISSTMSRSRYSSLLFGLFNLIAGTWMLVQGTELRRTRNTLHPVSPAQPETNAA